MRQDRDGDAKAQRATAPIASGPDEPAMTFRRAGPWYAACRRLQAGWHRLGCRCGPSPATAATATKSLGGAHAWVRRLRHAAVSAGARRSCWRSATATASELTDLKSTGWKRTRSSPTSAVTSRGRCRARWRARHRDGAALLYRSSAASTRAGASDSHGRRTGAGRRCQRAAAPDRRRADRLRPHAPQLLTAPEHRRRHRDAPRRSSSAHSSSATIRLTQRAPPSSMENGEPRLAARHQRARAPERLRGPGRHAARCGLRLNP